MLSEAETRLKLSIVFTELTTSYGCWRYNVGEGYNDTLDDVKVSHWKQSVWVLRWGKIPFEWPVLALLRPGYTFLVLSRLVCKIISHSDLSWTIRIHILRKKVQGLWRCKCPYVLLGVLLFAEELITGVYSSAHRKSFITFYICRQQLG